MNSTARRLYNEQSELIKTENRVKAELSQVTSWWKGNAAKAFIDNYHNQTSTEMNRLYTEIRDLKSSLEGLTREVQLADEQRRLEAQRQALLLQQQQQQNKGKK
nr:WXG100 family type VII secretion target [Paenibacillus segetis]